jgi:hypothetical protein
MIGVQVAKFNGTYSRERAGGGVPMSENWKLDRSGVRAGKVVDSAENPVAGILVGCLHIPTRKLVAHTRTDSNGDYFFDGLAGDSPDYMLFAYPDEDKLGAHYNFPRTWGLQE